MSVHLLGLIHWSDWVTGKWVARDGRVRRVLLCNDVKAFEP